MLCSMTICPSAVMRTTYTPDAVQMAQPPCGSCQQEGNDKVMPSLMGRGAPQHMCCSPGVATANGTLAYRWSQQGSRIESSGSWRLF